MPHKTRERDSIRNRRTTNQCQLYMGAGKPGSDQHDRGAQDAKAAYKLNRRLDVRQSDGQATYWDKQRDDDQHPSRWELDATHCMI